MVAVALGLPAAVTFLAARYIVHRHRRLYRRLPGATQQVAELAFMRVCWCVSS